MLTQILQHYQMLIFVMKLCAQKRFCSEHIIQNNRTGKIIQCITVQTITTSPMLLNVHG